MLRMRTVRQAITEIRESDPSTAISERAIKRLLVTNVIPSVQIGRKTLISMDLLEEYLSNPKPIPDKVTYGTIRPVKLK